MTVTSYQTTDVDGVRISFHKAMYLSRAPQVAAYVSTASVGAYLTADQAREAAAALVGFAAIWEEAHPKPLIPDDVMAVLDREGDRYERTDENQWRSVKYGACWVDRELDDEYGPLTEDLSPRVFTAKS